MAAVFHAPVPWYRKASASCPTQALGSEKDSVAASAVKSAPEVGLSDMVTLVVALAGMAPSTPAATVAAAAANADNANLGRRFTEFECMRVCFFLVSQDLSAK